MEYNTFTVSTFDDHYYYFQHFQFIDGNLQQNTTFFNLF